MIAALCVPLVLLAAILTGDQTILVCAIAGLLLLAFGVVLGSFLARRRPSAAPPSGDLRLVASRLLGLEKRVAFLASGRNPESDPVLTELTGDLSLLGALVKSLADALGRQERDISDLRSQIDRMAWQSPTTQRTKGSFDDRLTIGSRAGRGGLDHVSAGLRRVPSLIPSSQDPHDGPRPGGDVEPAVDQARDAAIAEALSAERLDVHLQPIVSLPQRRIRGYEMLSRLRLAEGTTLMPGEFMPALERRGLTGCLDEKVVARALVLAQAVTVQDGVELRLACNLSPSSLSDAKFVSFLERFAAEKPVGARKLVLELPQLAWRNVPPRVAGVFDRLRAAGVEFAMDRVTELEFEDAALGPAGISMVKVPGSLLAKAHDSEHDRATLARLAERRVRIVAERVEQERDVPDLIDLDVPLAQGFVFGRPRSVRADLGAETQQPAKGAAPASVGQLAPASPAEIEIPAAPTPLRALLRRVG